MGMGMGMMGMGQTTGWETNKGSKVCKSPGFAVWVADTHSATATSPGAEGWTLSPSQISQFGHLRLFVNSAPFQHMQVLRREPLRMQMPIRID